MTPILVGLSSLRTTNWGSPVHCGQHGQRGQRGQGGSTLNPTIIPDAFLLAARIATTQRLQAVLELLEPQETIGPGQKALLDRQILRCDTVYSSSGTVGRWFMNTLIRPTTTVCSRVELCVHLEWLVSKIESVATLVCQDPVRHILVDIQVQRLLSTLSHLIETYPTPVPMGRLEACRVRLMEVSTFYQS